MSLPRDVYTIRNRGSGTFLDLTAGNSADGTPVHGWQDEGSDAISGFNQRWLVTLVDGNPGVYKLHNLRGGTFLDLSDGGSANNTKIQGWNGTSNDQNENQYWRIVLSEVDGFWRLQNVRGGTFMNLLGTQPVNGTPIVGWEHANDDDQLWAFQPVTISGSNVNAALTANPIIKHGFTSYIQHANYICIPSAALAQVFQQLNLVPSTILPVNLDILAYSVKVAVLKWANDNILVTASQLSLALSLG